MTSQHRAPAARPRHARSLAGLPWLLVSVLVAVTTVGLGPATAAAPGTDTTTSASRPAAGPTPAPRLSARERYERQVLLRTNRRRVAHGCRALRANRALTRAARRHSALMAKHSSMEHQLPGERGLGPRITAAGYRGWRRVAENIAYGFPTAAAVVSAWMKSPGHRANILDCRLRHLGVGVVFSTEGPWVTQDFGRR